VALLELLDPHQNANYSDEYFDVTFDLSKVLFIATANSIENISYPLLNRMEVIMLDGYGDEEKHKIVKDHILPKIAKQYNIEKDHPILFISKKLILHLIKYYTKEPGVRELESLLMSLADKIATDIKRHKVYPSLSITKLQEYFGKARYDIKDLSQERPIAGEAYGLACNNYGGSILPVEATKMEGGKGKIKATGALGDILKESVDAAHSCVRARATSLNINPEVFKKYDLHIHIADGATTKDGPSAGITLFTAIASELSNKPVRRDLAMTGEIDIKGRVLKIGGLKNKLAAAAREGIKEVIIPKDNARDLDEIPSEIKAKLLITEVSRIEDLIARVFVHS
jgi:ATP-dependent Lon protease